jgi:hypothetical protein
MLDVRPSKYSLQRRKQTSNRQQSAAGAGCSRVGSTSGPGEPEERLKAQAAACVELVSLKGCQHHQQSPAHDNLTTYILGHRHANIQTIQITLKHYLDHYLDHYLNHCLNRTCSTSSACLPGGAAQQPDHILGSQPCQCIIYSNQ